MEDNKKVTGVLKVYDHIKGFGFIQREKGKDVFLHFSDVTDSDAFLAEGAHLAFNVEKTPKGMRARHVEIIG